MGLYLCNCLNIPLPNSCYTLTPGCTVQLGRFDTLKWIVNYGWYTWGGNRPVCGWYLTSEQVNKESITKPLQLTDLDDIYVITR